MTPAPEMAPQLATSSPEQETPGIDARGFSLVSQTDDELAVEYHDQAGLAVTPACELTGVPLIPHPESPTPSGCCKDSDDHHPEHPQKHSRLNDEGGLTVRHSRIITMNHCLHHISVHPTFRGPELPIVEAGIFYRAIFNAAGLIPRQAIFLHEPGKYSLVDLDESIRMYLWSEKLLRVERSGFVRAYFQTYVMKYAEQIIEPQQTNTIIAAETPMELWMASKNVLKAATVDVTRPIAATFRALYDQHLLPPTHSEILRPEWYGNRKVAGFLMGTMVNNRDGENSDFSRKFRERLIESREPNPKQAAA